MSTEETEWQDVDVEAVDKQYDAYKMAGERKFARKPPMGKSVWRAAPPRKDRPPTPFKEAWVHDVNHPVTGDYMFSGECPLKSGKGTFCAACKEVSRLRKSIDKAEKERGDRLRARMHVYISAAQLAPAHGQEDFKPDEGFVPLELAKDAYDTLAKAFKETVAAGGNFTHPDTGYDLVFERTPRKGPNGENWSDTKVLLARAPSKLKNREWLKKLPDLEMVAGQFSNEQVTALFRGEVEAPSEFPPREDQKALPPAEGGSQPQPGGTWSHPSKGQPVK